MPERVLFVHAHPDDESISTGGTIATLIDRGARVTVVTCTRGELGEVIPAELKYLEGSGERLAEVRTAELASAMAILGVTDHRFLGDANARWADRAPRRYTDSGMQWGEHGAEPLSTTSEDSLCAAPLGEVAADLATVIDAIKPDAVVSYDAHGGYGHPDHIRAYEASRRAAEVMNVPFYAIEPGDSEDSADPADLTDPADWTGKTRRVDVVEAPLRIDSSSVLGRKRDALRAHRTQVIVDGDRFSLSSGPSRPIAAVELFTRVRSEPPGTLAWKDQGFGIHLLAWILVLMIGAAVGGIATVNHQFTAMMFGLTVPVGIIATLFIVTALLAGLRIVFAGRLVVGLAAIGILGVIGVLSVASGGGSILVPANPAGYLLTYGPVVVTILVLAWPAAGTFTGDKLVSRLEPKGMPRP